MEVLRGGRRGSLPATGVALVTAVTAPGTSRHSLIGKLGSALRERAKARGKSGKLAAAIALARQHVVTAAALASVDIGAFHGGQVAGWVVTGISLLAFYQWIFRFLQVRLGMHTVILAHVSFSIAYVVIVVMARLRTVDGSLEEAALDLGANEWQAFRYVTLPAVLPAVVAAALLAFTVSFDDYVITSMVAGVDSETLPMVIYAIARRGVNPVVNAISALLVLGFGSLILISERLRTT